MLCKRVWDDRCVLFNLSVVFVKIDEIGQLFFSVYVVVVGIGKIRQMIVSNCYIYFNRRREKKKEEPQ